MTVRVESDARNVVVTPGVGFVDIVYQEATRLVLRFESTGGRRGN
jgi:hypothetical protein